MELGGVRIAVGPKGGGVQSGKGTLDKKAASLVERAATSDTLLGGRSWCSVLSLARGASRDDDV